MPTYEIQAPNGKTYQIDGPAGAAQSDVQAQVLQQFPEASGPKTPEDTIRAPQSFTERVEARKSRGSVMPFSAEAVRTGAEAVAPYIPLPKAAQEALPNAAAGMVPETPLGVGAAIGTLGASRYLAPLTRYPALSRIFGGATGGEAGNQIEGGPSGKGVGIGGGGAFLGEILGAGGSKVARSLPGAKGRINEGMTQDFIGTMTDLNPAAGAPIEAATAGASPLLRGGRSAAGLRSAVHGGTLQDAVSQRFDTALNNVAAAAGNPAFNGPAIQRAYNLMPQLARDEMIGPVAPGGFTLQQAHAVRSWIGAPAFAQSPLGQGVGHVPQQRLWGGVTQEIEAGIPPHVLPAWRQNNQEYGAMQALMEALGGANAFQGQPNRVFFNRSALSDYLANNEEDLTRRLGPAGFRALVDRALVGAQAGTRDVLASGAGTSTDAAMQSVGRGTNTGSINAVGMPLRTLLPNVGSQYTGRAPLTLPPQLQAILDVVTQRGTEGASNAGTKPPTRR